MNEQLNTLAERFWDRAMEESPSWATILGDHRFDSEVEDLTAEHEQQTIVDLTTFRDEAEAIDPASLSKNDRITRHVLMSEADGHIGALQSRQNEYLIDPMLGLHMDIVQGISQFRANEDAHAWAFVDKASKVGDQFDQLMERHRQGVANGRTPPRISVEKVIAQLESLVAAPAEANAFLQIALPQEMAESEQARWREAMTEQVRTVVNPAFERYRTMIANEVLPHARPEEKSGVCWLPDGEEIYSRAVARFTSLDLEPRQIHQIGLDEIGSIEDEYRQLGASVLGTTDLAEIYESLRSDPTLRFETPEQIQEQAERATARANEATPDWFGRLPVADCIVQPIPEPGAKDAPLAYYLPPADDGSRPGIFFINLTDPTSRTRYESEALAFHEGVPGHHFQLALAQELEGVPAFRRNGLVTVYVEGWGLYCERLGDEMGLYSGDLERFGILSFDSWRAGRLVVDTGLHALGWSRQQAIDYFLENSPQAQNNIENEVDRYIGYTGQALAYKLGQREIFRLRDEAKQTMGARFDIKGFHDTVLESGPVPLDLLSDLVVEWATS
ncbi:MAG: DUF885 domain-containing protein [Acidimicrobiia bacterium]